MIEDGAYFKGSIDIVKGEAKKNKTSPAKPAGSGRRKVRKRRLLGRLRSLLGGSPSGRR